MNIDVRGRRTGKTTDLIRLCHENGGYLVCINHAEAVRVSREAERLGQPIPFPLTPSLWWEGRFGLGVGQLYIDNLDMIIQSLTKVPIHTVTLSRPP